MFSPRRMKMDTMLPTGEGQVQTKSALGFALIVRAKL